MEDMTADNRLEMRENRKIQVVASVYSAYFLTGIFTTLFGPAMKTLMEDYRISIIKAGIFVSFVAIGRILAALFSGAIADRLGSKPVLLAGTLSITLGLAVIGTVSSYPTALMFCMLCGMGHGMINTSSSGVMADYYPGRLGKGMNMLNAFFGMGALAGPLLSGILLGNAVTWRTVFYVQAAVGFAMSLWIMTLKFPVKRSEVSGSRNPMDIKMLLRTGGSTFFLLALVMFIYTGSGHTINTWITKYLQEIVDLPVFIAAGIFAVYNLGLTLGRLICSLTVEKVGYERIILYSASGALLTYTVALSAHNGVLAAVCLGLTGLFFGGLFPTATAVACRLFPKNVGSVSGFLVVAAALGSMVIPALTGTFSQMFGIGRGLWFVFPFLVVLLAAAILLMRREHINIK